MYVIRKKGTRKYFWGMDDRFNPPRVKESTWRHLMEYFRTLSAAKAMLDILGSDYEIIQLRGRVVDVRQEYGVPSEHKERYYNG